MSIEDEIRQALIASGRNSADLSQETGIHAVNIRQFKTGSRGISFDALQKLAASLGMEIVARPVKKKKRK